MKKRTILRTIEALVFCAALFCTVYAVSCIMERKASTVRFKPLLDSAKDYDVLFVGDSLMVNGVFPMEMWENYGIASYNISSYGNTLPVTYWTLINALDYAEPELVVIGVKDVEKDYKLSGSSGDVHTAFDCYPLSLNKIRAIEDLMDDPMATDDDGNAYVDMKWEYYFTLGKYHARWDEITKGDFVYDLNRQKGGEIAVGVAAYEEYSLLDEWQAHEETSIGFTYLRRMIEECQKRGMDVMLVHLPYPASENAQMHANTVQYVADEYGIDYIDFVSLDQVVDYSVDCLDSRSHLNASGAKKVSAYLGRYIDDHYDIPDRRNDAQYAHWHDDFAAYVDVKRRYIDMQHQLNHMLMLLHDRDFSVQMYVPGESDAYWDDTVLTLMHNMVREHVFEEDAFAKWSNSLFPLEGLDEAAWAGEDYFLHADRANDTIAEYVGEEALEMAKAAGMAAGDEDVQIVVIDKRSGEIVVSRAFDL